MTKNHLAHDERSVHRKCADSDAPLQEDSCESFTKSDFPATVETHDGIGELDEAFIFHRGIKSKA